jgi:hypothetical protein
MKTLEEIEKELLTKMNSSHQVRTNCVIHQCQKTHIAMAIIYLNKELHKLKLKGQKDLASLFFKRNYDYINAVQYANVAETLQTHHPNMNFTQILQQRANSNSDSFLVYMIKCVWRFFIHVILLPCLIVMKRIQRNKQK